MQFEGGSASRVPRAFEVLAWTEEPEETNDDEVDGVLVEWTVSDVVEVGALDEVTEDGDVDRVGPSGRAVFIPEGFEKRSE